MSLGPPCYWYALNCHFVYLAIPGTRSLCTKKKICLFYLHAATKSEIQILSNKHETGLVVYIKGSLGKIFLKYYALQSLKIGFISANSACCLNVVARSENSLVIISFWSSS